MATHHKKICFICINRWYRLIHRLIIDFKTGEVDAVGLSRRKDIENFLQISVDSVKTRRVYTIDAELTNEELKLLKRDLFVDPINCGKYLRNPKPIYTTISI